MDFSEQSHIEGEAWDAICDGSLIRAKHIKDSISIEDLVMWHHYNVILENSDIILISC